MNKIKKYLIFALLGLFLVLFFGFDNNALCISYGTEKQCCHAADIQIECDCCKNLSSMAEPHKSSDECNCVKNTKPKEYSENALINSQSKDVSDILATIFDLPYSLVYFNDFIFVKLQAKSVIIADNNLERLRTVILLN